MLTLTDLVTRLPDYKINIFIKTHSSYFDVALMHNGQSELMNNVIYVCKTSSLPDNIRKISNIGLLLINDSCFDFSTLSADAAEVHAETNALELLNDVKEVFTASRRISESTTYLLRSLTKEKGLNNIIRIGSELLENPVILADASRKLMGYYSSVEVDDPSWENMIKYDYTPNEIVLMTIKDKLVDKIANSSMPIITDYGFAQDLRRIHGKISINNKMVAILGVMESNRKFRNEDIEIAAILCDVISIELQRNKKFSNVIGGMNKKILLDLIIGNVTQVEIIEERIKLLNLRLYNDLYILIVALNDVNFRIVEFLKQYFKTLFPTCLILEHDQNLILLLNFANSKELEAKEGTLIDLLNDNNLKASLSSKFEDIIDIRKHYLQAKKALAIGNAMNTDSRLFRYHDYYFYCLLSCIDRNINLKDLCYPELLKIIEYDNALGTQYYETLYEYLNTGQNMAATAKKLGIHRNTIAYRIEKIQGITGMDLRNGESCFKLFMSYKIMDMYENNIEYG